MKYVHFSAITVIILLQTASGIMAVQRREHPGLPPTLGLEQGLIKIDTPDFNLKLVRASQTIAALEPKSRTGFDFTPADLIEARAADGFYNLGDINLRVRLNGFENWKEYSSAANRNPIHELPLLKPESELARADLTPTLPTDCPVRIVRTWALAKGRLVMRFEITNTKGRSVQIGALGLPMIFNNILSRRSLEEAHGACSFFDPYLGLGGGYLQVTRLSGKGPALVVVPEEQSPFEAFRPLDEPMPPSQTFEGTFEWMVHSLAYAEKEWASSDPWNPPSQAELAPGESRIYGVKFLLSPGIREIEETLLANGRPVAVGIPGYILPMALDARLFLKYTTEVSKLRIEPEGALLIAQRPPTEKGWQAFTVQGKKWGRARLSVTYKNGLEQSIHYYVTKPAVEAVKEMGSFLFNEQWLENPEDPFGRGPSVISYDREKNGKVLQDSRVWIAGLGDEGGSGSWVAAAMKQLGMPDKTELLKLERFVSNTLWGRIQYAQGESKYGIRKSLFYYAPQDFPEGFYDSRLDWSTWASWDKKAAASVGRSYNYPHAAAVYWTMYRLARNYTGLVSTETWEWYLERAFQTGLAMVKFAPRYAQHGQMEGTIFLQILEELKREDWTEQASLLESAMQERTEVWKERAYPFGSEMAWDSTGQEEVYAWCRHFGYADKVEVSLNSILGYMPTLPHWGYNGNARRYWDFLYAGKWKRIERQLHHYGSGLNAIPLLTEYRDHPEDFYLLRVGYGGMMGALSNIDPQGFASAAFHSFPQTLAWDPYSGDYGPNFFGHSLNTAVYVIRHPEFGWLAFGGNLTQEKETIRVQPRDAFRQRVYLAPFGLWMTLDAGKFKEVEIFADSSRVRISLENADPYSPVARLRIRHPAAGVDMAGHFHTIKEYSWERGARVIPLSDTQVTWITLLIEK